MATEGTNTGIVGSKRKAEPLSNDDLGKYGVWVKSEPREIKPGNIMEDLALPIDDDGSGISVFEQEESGISSGKPGGNGKRADLDVEFSMDELDAEVEPIPEISENDDSVTLEDDTFELESENDDISIDTETLDTAIRRASGTAKGVKENPSAGDSGTSEDGSMQSSDVNIDDFLGEGSDKAETEGAEENPTLDINLEFDDTIDDSQPEKEMTDFDPSDFEDTVPAAGGSMELESVTDFDDFLNGENTVKEPGNKGLLKKAMPAQARGSPQKSHVSGADDLPEIEMETGDISSEDLNNQNSGFNDVEAVERDLLTSKPNSVPAQADNFSRDLLLKIASELSSIKDELSSLKLELATFRREPGTGEHSQAIPETELQDKKKAGFFEEDTDETIALTGDELDNILNTADFTEEAGMAVDDTDSMELGSLDELVKASEPELDDVIIADSLSDLGNIISEDGLERQEPFQAEKPLKMERPIQKPEPAISAVTIEPSRKSPHSEENLLSEAREVIPMTQLPEDTSYLDDDLGEVYLEESPLEEPDLSNIEHPAEIQEKHPEETIEEITLDDLTLSVDDTSGFGLEGSVEEIQQIDEMELATESIDFEPLSEENASEIKLSDETEPDGIPSFEEETAFMEMVEEPDFPDDPELLLEPEDLTETDEISLSENIMVEDEKEPPSKPEPFTVPLDTASTDSNNDLFVSPALLDNENEAPQTQKPFVKEKAGKAEAFNGGLKEDIKSVLLYMDKLLESLPDDKIDEFARSEHFTVYKKLFEELGLI